MGNPTRVGSGSQSHRLEVPASTETTTTTELTTVAPEAAAATTQEVTTQPPEMTTVAPETTKTKKEWKAPEPIEVTIPAEALNTRLDAPDTNPMYNVLVAFVILPAIFYALNWHSNQNGKRMRFKVGTD